MCRCRPSIRKTSISIKNKALILVACLATLPGLYARLAHSALPPLGATMISGLAIMSASFLLVWACDAAQADVSQSLALAVVALMAVLPEYAVDMYFTWQAGKFPESNYASYAVANMTGANRLIIGVAWLLIAFIIWLRTRQPIHIESERRLEIVFLFFATLYALAIPIKGTLAWYDMLVFLGIYGAYMFMANRRPPQEMECEGPALLLVRLPKGPRRLATALLFLFAGGAILANAGPFCEGLVATGRVFHINEFFLVQWLGPIASEAPEFVVAIMFAWRGQGSLALGSLLSSKLNQWTLLVGMMPGCYAIAHGSLDHPLPLGPSQIQEILLTAAQSLLAVFMIAHLRLSVRHAAALFVLFFGQLVSPMVVNLWAGNAGPGLRGSLMHPIFTLLYLTASVGLFVQHPRRLFNLVKGLRE